jgi:hypothetical protein
MPRMIGAIKSYWLLVECCRCKETMGAERKKDPGPRIYAHCCYCKRWGSMKVMRKTPARPPR